jgi:carbon monoxide dehydrogenase subunit G
VLIENTFDVDAAPDTVFVFLLDINRVAGCVPGVELAEVVDADTFNGKVKIKVGPITVAYSGSAKIVERDADNHSARIQFSGRETTGPGGTEGAATMSVEGADGHSHVKVSADFVVRGRVANFGRGVMEDVSRRLVNQMADCIKAQLEAPAVESAAGTAASASEEAAAAGTAGQAPATPAVAAPAKPVNAISLFFMVLWDRIRRLFRRRE